ncbi:NAD(P)/FAD-dependent oxidoreductase [Paraburkholderia sabiae]|uniref:FAD-dependent oxidoreductase n=1 Tax=Paraburkholderia sabiae TaxID=273251 RepID=A0ABU9QLW5_9BURK|nr:hypothetical protein LMG24235_04487 [Paraburkholderia sabiae]
MVRLSGDAPDRLFELVRDLGICCEARQAGTIRAAFTEANAAFLKRAAEGWQTLGAPVQFLDRAAIASATGTDRYLCGTLDFRGGSVNPLAYSRGLAEAASHAGADIYTHTTVTGIRRVRGNWTLSTPGGRIAAEWIVSRHERLYRRHLARTASQHHSRLQRHRRN